MDYEDKLKRDAFINSLYNKSHSTNTQHGQIRSSFLDEIIAGRILRDQYANELGLTLDKIVRDELRPTISYVQSQGALSTDEPPVEPIGTARGDIDLARLPIYRALLKDIAESK